VRYRGRILFCTDSIQFEEDSLWPRIAGDVLAEIRRAGLETDAAELITLMTSKYGVAADDVCRLLDQLIAERFLEDIHRVRFRSIDFSLTNWCNATCIYCATPRLNRAREVMSRQHVHKILLDLADPAFTDLYGTLVSVEIGGTTEPLLNPEILDILRDIKKLYPTKEVTLYTNGVLLQPALGAALLAENLITSLVVSIDGLTAAEHTACKGVSYAGVERNVREFMATRARLSGACSMQLNVMTYRRYCSNVQAALGRNPLAVATVAPSLEDSTEAILAKWRPMLRESDVITPAVFQLRGEYKQEGDSYPVPEEELPCPWIGYVIHSINIASNGDWFICCNDFFRESVLGNVLSERLPDVAARARDPFIEALIRNDRSVLPARCRFRKYCQFLPSPGNVIAV
jgi:hypothetical protein